MNELAHFYSLLKQRKNSLTVYNPYRDENNLHNLECYLEFIIQQQAPRIMLVGEAPGFKGCRLTGIPFSCGRIYTEIDHPFLRQLHPRLKLNTTESENTAVIVWRELLKYDFVPLFWNAFPFHPHPSRLQKKNRAPNQVEMKEGAVFLEMLVEYFQPDVIAGVGRKGTESVQGTLPNENISYIRHPSYGGKHDFCDGLGEIYVQCKNMIAKD